MDNKPPEENEFEKRLRDPEWCNSLSKLVLCRYNAKKRRLLTLCGFTGAVFTLVFSVRIFMQNSNAQATQTVLIHPNLNRYPINSLQNSRMQRQVSVNRARYRKPAMSQNFSEVSAGRWQSPLFPVSIGYVSFP